MEEDLKRIKEIEIELNEIAKRNNFVYDINTMQCGNTIAGTWGNINIRVSKILK